GIGGHISVGNDAILYPQSGVPNDVAPGEILVGTPAFEVSAFWRAVAVFQKIGEVPKRLRALEKRLDEVGESKSAQRNILLVFSSAGGNSGSVLRFCDSQNSPFVLHRSR